MTFKPQSLCRGGKESGRQPWFAFHLQRFALIRLLVSKRNRHGQLSLDWDAVLVGEHIGLLQCGTVPYLDVCLGDAIS